MTFICVYHNCYHLEEFAEEEPETWLIDRYAAKGAYRHKCPKCGSAMAPASFLKDGTTIDDVVMTCFSDCVNAGVCLGWDQYGPDCETPGLKQKCLRAVFQEIVVLQSRLDAIEKRLPGKRKPRQVKDSLKGSNT